MNRAIYLAQRAIGFVKTNPLVGCVIVYNNTIIAEGWHQKFGSNHAEVDAISKVNDISILNQCEMYVTLEPCNHFGKTPACCPLIIQHQFKKIYIGTLDPNPLVNSKGIQALKEANIPYEVGILEHECQLINEHFWTNQIKIRPFIYLKWAQTADGYMGKVDYKSTSPKISAPLSDVFLQKLRFECDAILVGKNTVLIDNPLLSERFYNQNNLIPIVMDTNLEIDISKTKLISHKSIIIINNHKEYTDNNIIYIKNEITLEKTISKLLEYQIGSILVEGGAKILNSFISNQLWDRALSVQSDIIWKNGIAAPSINLGIEKLEKIGNDQFVYYKNVNQ